MAKNEAKPSGKTATKLYDCNICGIAVGNADVTVQHMTQVHMSETDDIKINHLPDEVESLSESRGSITESECTHRYGCWCHRNRGKHSDDTSELAWGINDLNDNNNTENVCGPTIRDVRAVDLNEQVREC
jgi:hypothetical protein